MHALPCDGGRGRKVPTRRGVTFCLCKKSPKTHLGVPPLRTPVLALGSWRVLFYPPYRQQAGTTGLGTSDSPPDGHVGASCASVVSTCWRKRPRSTAPPLPTGPATLGSGGDPGRLRQESRCTSFPLAVYGALGTCRKGLALPLPTAVAPSGAEGAGPEAGTFQVTAKAAENRLRGQSCPCLPNRFFFWTGRGPFSFSEKENGGRNPSPYGIGAEIGRAHV